MQSSKEFLETCYALGLKGAFQKAKGDRRVARGFADLGYEEFLLRQEKKLSSLYTGTISEMPEAHKAFFFTVPTIENLIDAILENKCEIKSLEFVTQRFWKLIVHKVGIGDLPPAEHKEIETAFAKALLQTFEG